jgi:hypothetical protein
MNRSNLERELKKVGVNLNGWLPVLDCDVCGKRWEPFAATAGTNTPTARFDYWKCPNRCNANGSISPEIQTALPSYVVINDVPGMIFDEDDLPEFERYVRSMDATEVFNKGDG